MQGSQRAAHLTYPAVLLAIFIWAGWFPVTRIALYDGLSAPEIALLRFAPATLLFAPFWAGLFRKLRDAPRWTWIALLGWGAPFVLSLSTGLRQASVAEAAALVPCLVPLMTMLGERFLTGRAFSRAQKTGFVFIALCASIIFLMSISADGSDPSSLLFLLIAALGWTGFTLSFPRSGLSAIEATAYISLISFLGLLPYVILDGNGFGEASALRLMLHLGVQGILAGLVAIIAFSYAITHLGTQRAAVLAVLVPSLATFIAWVMLGEIPSTPILLALILGSIGVGLVNGIHQAFRRDHSI